jgi:hypothetical protein
MFVRLVVGGALALGLLASDAVLAGSAEARMYKGKPAQGHWATSIRRTSSPLTMR